MRHVLITLALTATTAFAQPAPEIGFTKVADALKALQARDGNGTIVTHSDDWVVINEPLAAAQWSFTPPGHYAHPALVRRVIQRSGSGAVAVQLSTLCEAPREACDKLEAEFEAMNERITQSVRARGRQGSTQPPANQR